jgi:chromosome segregation ATPase
LGCASSNLSSGRYDRDTARLAARAAKDMDRAESARRTSVSLTRDRSDLQAEAGRLRAALSAADKAVAEARTALVRVRADGRSSGSELSQLTERLESVQSKRSLVQSSGLENEVAALDQDVARLRQMVLTLSGR